MADNAKIQSYSRVIPMIYAYTTPGVDYHKGWTKIGYTEKQTVDERIRQQTHTAGIQYRLEWKDNALYRDGSGEYFTDRDFHSYLESQAGIERKPGTEWFHTDGPTSQQHFDAFSRRTAPIDSERLTYALRDEQQAAVDMTKAYFDGGGTEFLWNAKPRFGKTLTSYDLIMRMGFTNVLIVTNRPSIANSWAEDFSKFIGWRGEYSFVSDTDALKGKKGVLSREEFLSRCRYGSDDAPRKMISFESLQGLKGSVYFGGEYDKLEWMATYRDALGKLHEGIEFDLLIVDESQEGVDTMKTDQAFRNIRRKHTLYLSGTPFKQLASDQFSRDQIFNWSYADEQEAKACWEGPEDNPYETLPKLAMFTYQLSGMIREKIERGLDLSDEGDTVDYAFDLNEFFATNDNGKFVHEDEIRKFLRALYTQEKYPFSTPELRRELSHTMWYLNRVASAYALEELLHDDPVFGSYKVVVAAGDVRSDDDAQAAKAYDLVRDAIAKHDKTITLTVGQLTVGVTIPEWSGVLMLCNMKSPSSYMQAAFRAQNPCILTRDGQRYRKDTAYVFDFDPARTLIIFDEFANNLSADTANGRGTGDDRKENIKRLLNFFPVLGEDSEGRMVELDAAQVLSIPRKLKSQEVVRRGFMSNFLFQNISNIFGAPAVVREIVEKIAPAHEEGKKADSRKLDGAEDVSVNEDGEVEIPKEKVINEAGRIFGPKIYEVTPDIQSAVDTVVPDPSGASNPSTDAMDRYFSGVGEALKAHGKANIVAPVAADSGLKKGVQAKLDRAVDQKVDQTVQRLRSDYEQQTRIAQADRDRKLEQAATEQDVRQANKEFVDAMNSAASSAVDAAKKAAEQFVEDTPTEVVEKVEKNKKEQEKKSLEDKVRDHLRGFSRTIPSFIMAYGDGSLTLANFDSYVEGDVFKAVTSITLDEFRLLRDGGDAVNPKTGMTEYFKGHLFDEVVFDDSVDEFWNKKQQLANYFDEGQDEDIFDYIPPQKTNQIFTPRWVVSMMVDKLEENNPGCFDDPGKTFADLYMKSGLYITEIVKRLYQSSGLKSAFPDGKERIRHILEHQVYGMAPTRIIYLIATNYILGFDDELKNSTHNFVEADAAEAAKAGTLDELVDRYFGKDA